MSLLIKYGYESNYVDVTKLALRQCLDDTTLIIPKDNRLELFGDHAFNQVKFISIDYNGGKILTINDVKLDISAYLKEDRKEPPVGITILYGANSTFRDVTN